VGNLDTAIDRAAQLSSAAERAGVVVSDRDNPRVAELARGAHRLGISLCSLLEEADRAVC
jgi:hypothetical protein